MDAPKQTLTMDSDGHLGIHTELPMPGNTPDSPSYSPQSPGYYSSDGEPYVDPEEGWGSDRLSVEEAFQQEIADAVSANKTTLPASWAVPFGERVAASHELSRRTADMSPTTNMDATGPTKPPANQRPKCHSRIQDDGSLPKPKRLTF